MQNYKNIQVGIGFATGRESFQKVLRTYIHTWKESGLVENKRISLNLFVAYDLNYNNTKITDYTNIQPELADQIDSSKFIGSTDIKEEIDYLIKALNMRWIIISQSHNNKNYIRMVKRIGFRKEAHFVESLLINGKLVKI